MNPRAPYYRQDLALIHHRGFGNHAERCADDVLRLIAPVRGGTILELGCGSGLLTRRLVDAGHHVIATDASPAMLELAAREVPGAASLRRLTLPDEQLPPADAIVSVGHVINYLHDRTAVERALSAIATALRPGGVLALDLCDLKWGSARRDSPPFALVEDDWALITLFSTPTPTRFVREITTFIRNDDGSWRRDDEHHDNVLIDTARVPGLLDRHGLDAEVRPSFGEYPLLEGLVAVVGRRRST